MSVEVMNVQMVKSPTFVNALSAIFQRSFSTPFVFVHVPDPGHHRVMIVMQPGVKMEIDITVTDEDNVRVKAQIVGPNGAQTPEDTRPFPEGWIQPLIDAYEVLLFENMPAQVAS